MFPEGSCACGADLAGAADLGVRYSYQVTDLPEARAVTTQYDQHEVECGCGQVHVAEAPPEAAGAPRTVTYGLNFQAWCVFLLVMHHVPVERCANIIESMSGTRPSDGWVHTLLHRAARAVAAANQAIRALIILALVICGDETSLRAGPGPKSRKKYLQVACTNLLTLTSSATGTWLPSRTPSTSTCTARSSCTTGTRTTTPSTATATSCAASAAQHLEDAAQSYPDAIWPGQIADALRGLIHQANLARDQGLATIPGDLTAEDLTLFRRGVAVGLSQVHRVPGAKNKQPPARTLLECLRRREADVLRFLTDTAISPTSNQADYAEFGVMRTRGWMPWHAGEAGLAGPA